MDLPFERAEPIAQAVPQFFQIVDVDLDTGLFHAGKNPNEWQFDLGQERRRPSRFNLLGERLHQAKDRHRAPGGRVQVWPVAEVEHALGRRFALVVNRLELERQEPSGQVRQPVVPQRWVDYVGGESGVEGETGQIDVVVEQSVDRGFGIVQVLGDATVFENCLKVSDRFGRHEDRFMSPGGHHDAGQVGSVPYRVHGERAGHSSEPSRIQLGSNVHVEHLAGGTGRSPAHLDQPAPQRVELELVKHLPHLALVPLGEPERLDVDIEVDRPNQLHELPVQEHLLAGRGQVL